MSDALPAKRVMWRVRALAPYGPPVAAVLFLLSGPVMGAVPDYEEYRNTVLSMTLQGRAILDGSYVFWTSALGFGVPQPLHPAILLHPLLPVFGLLTPDTAVRLYYAVQAAVGAMGCWWLVRRLHVGPWIAGLAVSTWALSTPAQNYALTDLWPAEFTTWSLAPYLLLGAWLMLESTKKGQPWLEAMGFGLVAGLIVVNGHAGYVPVFFVGLGLVGIASPRRVLRILPALMLATLIGTAIAAPTLVHVLVELERFPPLPRLTAEETYGAPQLLDMVLRPLPLGVFSESIPPIGERGTRIPYFGGPMLLLVLAYITTAVRTRPYRHGLVVAFLVSFGLMTGGEFSRAGVLSAAFLFRDPMILFGIVLGSLALQALSTRRRNLATAIGVLQLAVLVPAAWPFVAGAWHPDVEDGLFAGETAVALQEWTGQVQGRWYLAPEVDELIRRGFLDADGLWPDSWAYYDLPIVNGTFRGISADPIYTSGSLPVGRIRGHRASVTSSTTLDVLGIGGVLATASEPVAATLDEIAQFPTRTAGTLRLLRNAGAWPGAAFVDERVRTLNLAPLPGCQEGGLLCSDFSPVATLAGEYLD